MKYSAKAFADDSGVSVKLAKRIIDLLDEKDLEPTELGTMIWRLRDFVMKNNMAKLMEKLSDEEIKGMIDEMLAESEMWSTRCPADVACAQNAEQLSRAFAALSRPEAAWFFAAIDAEKPEGGYKEGDTVTIQMFRVGEWDHPGYGKVTIDQDVIKDVVKNFADNVRKIEIAIDENHEENHRALGWLREVYSEKGNKECYGKIELTKKGADLLNDGAYRYFSPEIVFHKMDEESGDPISNLLIGGAFTNRPFFKGMQPLMATEGAAVNGQRGASASNPYFFSHNPMHKLLLAMDKILTSGKFTAPEKAELEMLFNELPASQKNADLNTKVAELIARFDEAAEAAPAETPAETPVEAPAETETPAETPVEVPAETTPENPEAKPEGVEGEMTANEDGTFTVDQKFIESVKKTQKNLSDTVRKATFSECESRVNKMCFSEKTPLNVILPKNVKQIATFAAGLSDANRKVFFDIMATLKAVPAGEKGHGQDASQDFTDPAKIPQTDEKVQYFMETLHQPLEIAQKSAADYYGAQATRK